MWPRVPVMVSGLALDLVVGSAQQLDRDGVQRNSSNTMMIPQTTPSTRPSLFRLRTAEVSTALRAPG